MRLIITALILIALSGCGSSAEGTLPDDPIATHESDPDHEDDPTHDATEQEVMSLLGADAVQAMIARHDTPVPAEFIGVNNPTPADEASVTRGREIYEANCLNCHGAGGMGDGPAAVNLDPPPAPIAMSSQMLADDYLFWRVTKGGVQFGSLMPQFEEILDTPARWDVLNYVRSFGG